MNSVDSPALHTPPANRLAVIRRVYFYLVAFVSLVAGLMAAESLINVLLNTWLADAAAVNDAGFVRNAVARSGGLLLITTPIFLVHWLSIQRITGTAQPARAAETTSALRKLFLYGTMGFLLVLVLLDLLDVLRSALGQLLNTPSFYFTATDFWLSTLLSNLINLGINGAFLAYFAAQTRGDGDLGHEYGWAGTLRRLFQMIFGLVGLAMLIFGTANLLESLLRLLLEQWVSAVDVVGAQWWRNQVSDGVAMLLTGALLWWTNWRYWESMIARHADEDAHGPAPLLSLRRHGVECGGGACADGWAA